MVLLRGLSPNSAAVTALQAKIEFGKRPGERVNTVEGPEAAQAAFESIFKPPS